MISDWMLKLMWWRYICSPKIVCCKLTVKIFNFFCLTIWWLITGMTILIYVYLCSVNIILPFSFLLWYCYLTVRTCLLFCCYPLIPGALSCQYSFLEQYLKVARWINFYAISSFGLLWFVIYFKFLSDSVMISASLDTFVNLVTLDISFVPGASWLFILSSVDCFVLYRNPGMLFI